MSRSVLLLSPQNSQTMSGTSASSIAWSWSGSKIIEATCSKEKMLPASGMPPGKLGSKDGSMVVVVLAYKRLCGDVDVGSVKKM